eukprot:m.27489 g.27489  ORF g.27489 m.27489 type:complete len:1202 (-) comp4429_c0_seq1:98-3703(-)
MYIKQVTIQGFKSYRDQTIVDPFSPKHNVVVGRNGSGKSNFFFAIRFVLSDMFSTLRAEERQLLLHEGAGMAAMSAYVEIVFDNTDFRIPVEKEEVVLRRAIGLKKDEYFLDNKHVTKNDVANLLESSGFSRSNPYYIVQQGKINSLALAKDSERLQLLKEVAGTSVYDERRAQSISILEDTRNKRARIEEVLGYIEQRLGELESEKNELKRYQELDRDHRCIEYTLHSKELEDVRVKLDEVEVVRQRESERAQTSFDALLDAQVRMKTLEDEMSSLRDTIQALTTEKKELEGERQETLRLRTKAELDVHDLERGLADARTGESRISVEMKELTRSISEKEKQLGKVLPQFQKVVEEEEALNERLEQQNRTREELFAKQSRHRQFSSAQARDKWLNSEIKSLKQTISEKKVPIAALKKEIADQERLIEKMKTEKTEREAQLVERRKGIDTTMAEHHEKKHRQDQLQNERTKYWRDEAAIRKEFGELKERASAAERSLLSSTSRPVRDGLESIKRIQQELQLPGVHGPLIELISVSDKTFNTATDVVGGNSLFNVVVDTDVTASKILAIMKERRLPGRVTFLPLNRLHPKEAKFPEDESVIPLIKKLSFDPTFRPAVLQIFGRTLVCRTEQIASQYARAEGLTGITLNGRKVDRKGVLQGGYIDQRTVKINLQVELSQLRSQAETKEEELKKNEQVFAETEQTINTLVGELRQAESRQQQLRQAVEHLREDIASLATRIADSGKALEQKQALLASSTADLGRLDSQLAAYQTELGTEMQSQLDEDDEAQVRACSDEIERCKRQLNTLASKRSELESKKNELELDLTNNLRKRLSALEEEHEQRDPTLLQNSLAEKQSDLHKLAASIEETKARVEEIDRTLAKANKEHTTQSNEYEDLRAKERERLALEVTTEKSMEQILSKRSLLIQKKDECMRKIRELGSLPSEAFSKYQKTSMKQLYSLLAENNAELKKFSHVNKKALDQYVSFSSQRDELLERKKEQDAADEKIQELIAVLDGQKDEAIERTFKQVAKNFTEVFKELVPEGRASLVMQRRRDEAADDEPAAADTSRTGGRIENYVGVGIRVSFTGRSDETHLVQQLSGGQKTVVALGLIFAIQRCDPAPFYLFDEIDQALDATHRTAVAEMIHRMSDKAQFITTTFRPEMLTHADKCYGVTYGNKVSHIQAVTKKQALDFIEEEHRQAD